MPRPLLAWAMLLFVVTVHAATVPPSTLIFNFTRRRSGTNDVSLQLSRLVLYDARGSVVAVTSESCPLCDSPASQRVEKLFDGDFSTKWTDRNFGTVQQVEGCASFTVVPLGIVTSYELFSADNPPGHGPVHWTVGGQTVCGEWLTLDDRTLPSSDYLSVSRRSSYGTPYSLQRTGAVDPADCAFSTSFRFEFSEVRDGASATGVQLGGLTLHTDAGAPPAIVIAASNPGGSAADSDAEGASKLIDGDSTTAWYDGNLSPSGSSTIELTLANATRIASYEFVTASGDAERDPASWTFSRLHFDGAWEVLQTVTSGSVTSERLASSGRIWVVEKGWLRDQRLNGQRERQRLLVVRQPRTDLSRRLRADIHIHLWPDALHVLHLEQVVARPHRVDDEAAVLPRDGAVRAAVEHHTHAVEGEVCPELTIDLGH
eukprot:CAMPEP_0181233414 /NCGR_PEP_ID=MMETSP1096-20121128/36322_1 /TAXON_ID=156174 ORGANISM="Chrysochromulina ericina, Strain CCMP281" /NCGR_SAMPLE_ID=MMETSP1096 /ASSEMBLY_ACC=CAM_ASM_000453 /LENGTH=429 /DNA_ID=CAMNT_0023327911 /DNA_START=44 /DNA_END=1330 /DNA_ORIENTATION=+